MSEEYENEPMDVTNDAGAPSAAAESESTGPSTAQVYVKPVPRDLPEDEFKKPFEEYGVVSFKLLQGYGFIEFESKESAEKAIEQFHGASLYSDEPMTVEFSRSKREAFDENAPRYRAIVENIPEGTSWQDLKDFARDGGFDVPFSVIDHEKDATGILEFSSKDDLDRALTDLSGKEFRGNVVSLEIDTRPPPPRRARGGRGGRGGFGGRGGRGRGGRGGRGYDRRDSFGRGSRGGPREYRDYDRYDRRDDRRDDYRDRRGGYDRRDDYRRGGGDYERRDDRRDDYRERRYRSRSPRRDGGRSPPPPPPPGGEPSW